MSDFNQMIEEYATKDDFPEVGNPEITYRNTIEDLDYEWIQIDTDGHGEYVLRNPQIRTFRDFDELPAIGNERVLYIVHKGVGDEREHYMWMGFGDQQGYKRVEEDEYYNKYPCPGHVTAEQAGAYCRPANRYAGLQWVEFTDINELPDVGSPTTLYERRNEDGYIEHYRWSVEKQAYMVWDPNTEVVVNGRRQYLARALTTLPEPGEEGVEYYIADNGGQYQWVDVLDSYVSAKLDPNHPHAPPVRSPRHPARQEPVRDSKYLLATAHVGQEQHLDAGQRAREKVKKRGAMYRIKWFFIWLLLILLVALGGIGYFGYTQWENRVVEWRTDYHKCYAKLGNTVVEGQRKYRYKATTVMGYRYLSDDEVKETTELRRSSLAFRLVGVVDEIPWTHVNENSQGKEYVELFPTDRYTFISANDINVVSYAEFCNSAKPIEE